MARRIGGWLAGAILTDDGSLGNIEWFEKKGDVALACLLWAAAVSGHTITDVFNWAQLFGHEDALHVLATHPDSTPQMLAVVKRMLADNRTSGSVRDTIELSLSWAIIPTLAAAVSPAARAGVRPGPVHQPERHALPDRVWRRGLAGNAVVPGLHLVCALRRWPDGHPGSGWPARSPAADGPR